MTIKDLRGPLAPPGQPDPVTTWAEVEQAFGMAFPADYKEWCAEYPSLMIDEYLTVHNMLESPASRELELALGTSELLRECTSALRGNLRRFATDGRIKDGDDLTFYPEPGGVLVVAVSDNNELLCWPTAPTPNAWTISATDNKYWEWWDSGSGFTATLTGILSGRTVCGERAHSRGTQPLLAEPILLRSSRD